MSNGSNIAAEVMAGLAEAGTAVGTGPMIGTIKRKGVRTGGPDYAPVYGPDTTHHFVVIYDTLDFAERNDTAVSLTDTKILAAVSDITPTTADKITIGADEFSIYRVTPLRTGGTDLMFSILARK